MRVDGFTVGKHNGHPCPPRLLALAALSRQVAPPHPSEGDASTEGPVTLPGHVVTGALGRGRMLGCVALMVDAEREMIRERSATAKRCLALRPASVTYEEWSAELAKLLMSGDPLEQIEETMAAMAAERDAACSMSSSSE